MTYSTFAVLAALILPLNVAAQEPSGPGPAAPETDRGWFAFGFGPSIPYGFAFAATANFGRERVLQVGAHGVGEFELFGRSEHVSTLHVGPGLSRVDRWSRLAVAAGPAVVWGVRDASNAESDYVTAGLVLSGQAIVTPIPELGLGLDAFAILSPIKSGVGFAVTFVFEANK